LLTKQTHLTGQKLTFRLITEREIGPKGNTQDVFYHPELVLRKQNYEGKYIKL